MNATLRKYIDVAVPICGWPNNLRRVAREIVRASRASKIL